MTTEKKFGKSSRWFAKTANFIPYYVEGSSRGELIPHFGSGSSPLPSTYPDSSREGITLSQLMDEASDD